LRSAAKRQAPSHQGPAPAPEVAGPDTPEADRPGAHRQATRFAALGFVLVAALHVWILSAGGAALFPSYSAYYDRLAGGCLRGQTSLTLMPVPAHLSLPDPYDPVANRPFRQRPGVHDAVLFKGKFYLYWGPVPALLLAPVKWATGWRGIGDENLVLVFALGTTALTALTLRRLWARFFADQPPGTLLVAIVVAGAAAPLGYFMARPAVYEAAIMGGQFFLMAGLYAVCGASSLSPWRLAVASACWSLAVGCRASLAIAVTVLAAMVAWDVLREGLRAEGRLAVRRLLALGLPLVAGAVSLAAYNHARFGSVLEFGQRYQLTSANYNATPALFSVGNVWPGLYSYTLRPLRLHDQFPFLEAVGGGGTFPSFIRIPKYYEFNEPIAGLLLVTPFLWLAALPAVAILRRAGGRAGETAVAGRYLVASFVGFAPVLFMVGSTMRYLVDLAPCLVVVAAMGIWQSGRTLANAPRGRRRFSAMVIALAAYSVVVGLLLSFSGYYDHFYSRNHNWFARHSYRTAVPGWYAPPQNSSPVPAASEPEQRNAGSPDTASN
jgi:hypothetical protein